MAVSQIINGCLNEVQIYDDSKACRESERDDITFIVTACGELRDLAFWCLKVKEWVYFLLQE